MSANASFKQQRNPGVTELLSVSDGCCTLIGSQLLSYLDCAQKPIAGSALGEPLTNSPAWKTIPSLYVVATQDRAINPDLERFMARRTGARITELSSGRLVFITRAGDVARIIEEAAK